MIQWVINKQLARSQRPGYTGERGIQVSIQEVDAWIQEAKDHEIKSIICLLGSDQIGLYTALPDGLIRYYHQHGFAVEHIPVYDHRQPPLKADQLKKVWEAYKCLPKPALVHCSAGVDRTGAAITYIKKCLDEKLRESRWCGTPMMESGEIKPPKQEKMGDTPKIVEKNLIAWCGTPQIDEDHHLSQAEGLKAGSAPSEGDGPRDTEASRAKADEPKKPKPSPT